MPQIYLPRKDYSRFIGDKAAHRVRAEAPMPGATRTIGTLKDYPTERLAHRALGEHMTHVNKISYPSLQTSLRAGIESAESIWGFHGN